jgi:hypothetical protein
METPRLLSEYFAASAQSDGRISAQIVVDLTMKAKRTMSNRQRMM